MCSLASMPHSITTSSLLRAMPSGCLQDEDDSVAGWKQLRHAQQVEGCSLKHHGCCNTKFGTRT
jgi:hypothetical protein